jgi:hypothetical protein
VATISPYIFLDSEDLSSAFILVEANEHIASYENLHDGKMVKFPLREVISTGNLSLNDNAEPSG